MRVIDILCALQNKSSFFSERTVTLSQQPWKEHQNDKQWNNSAEKRQERFPRWHCGWLLTHGG
jgi:hypothetical protein